MDLVDIIEEKIDEEYQHTRSTRVTVSMLSKDLSHRDDVSWMDDFAGALETLHSRGKLEAVFALRCSHCNSAAGPSTESRKAAEAYRPNEVFCSKCQREYYEPEEIEIVPRYFVEIPDGIEDHILREDEVLNND